MIAGRFLLLALAAAASTNLVQEDNGMLAEDGDGKEFNNKNVPPIDNGSLSDRSTAYLMIKTTPQTMRIQSNNNNVINYKLNSMRTDKFQSDFNEYSQGDNTTLLQTKSLPVRHFNENLNRPLERQFARLNSTNTATLLGVERANADTDRKYIRQDNGTVVASEFLSKEQQRNNNSATHTNGTSYLNNAAAEKGHKLGPDGFLEKIKLARGGINERRKLAADTADDGKRSL